MLPVVLASQSPRRRELLTYLISDFESVGADLDESVLVDEKPEQYVSRLSLQKALVVAKNYENHLVIGCDTSVVIDDQILGKPEDKDQCLHMLSMLSQRTHQVYTAFSIVTPGSQCTQVIKTDVKFKTLSHQEMLDYWLTGEPKDKAGSYAIQGIGGKFVVSVNGSVSSVIGLPLAELDDALKQVEQ